MNLPSNLPSLVARAAFSAGLLAALVACGSADSAGSKVGNLGRGKFRYTCISTDGDDSTCPNAGVAQTRDFDFPSSLAVGGAFKLAFEPNADIQSQLGNPILKPASDEYLSDAQPGGIFVAKKPGRVAIVARSTANGQAADLTYVRIASPLKLKLNKGDGTEPPPKVTLKVNDKFVLRAEAYADHDVRLGGTVNYEWTSDAPTVVKLDGGTPNARMPFVANAAGTAKVTAKLDALTVSLDVEVTP